jgi:hypothetical protein
MSDGAVRLVVGIGVLAVACGLVWGLLWVAVKLFVNMHPRTPRDKW